MKIQNAVCALMLAVLCAGVVSGQDLNVRKTILLENMFFDQEWKSTIKAFDQSLAKSAGSRGYDVHYYKIDLNVNHLVNEINGTVTMRAKSTVEGLNTMQVDFYDNMAVSSVTGDVQSYSRSDNIIYVTLDQPADSGEDFSITISYSGTPSTINSAFTFREHNGQPIISSLSEPFYARAWWPCNDDPADKADSVDINITVAQTLTATSNGKLTEVVVNNDGTHTFKWHEKYPICTYLVSVAISNYEKIAYWYKYSPTDSMEVPVYVYPEEIDNMDPGAALTVTMLQIYSDMFGQYPFIDEQYAQSRFSWGGGMEHQTNSSMTGFSVGLCAHELAHQWWGDMLSPKTWHDIWLNEGFATYATGLFYERHYDENTFQNYMAGRADRIFTGSIYQPDLTANLFADIVYSKGAWVLHMLRHVVGDSSFFQILKEYGERYKYANASTDDFRTVCEEFYGDDLSWFFDEWIYGTGRPKYRFSWKYASSGMGNSLDITLDQVQSTSTVFKMPVDIAVQTNSGWQTYTIINDQQYQNYSLNIQDVPSDVVLDRDNWILKHIYEPVSQDSITAESDILVVNGVHWDTYNNEILDMYNNQSITGRYSYDFWDFFSSRPAAYTGPEPKGTGILTDYILSKYKYLILFINDYAGDKEPFNNSIGAIDKYMSMGGKVIIAGRRLYTLLAYTKLQSRLHLQSLAENLSLSASSMVDVISGNLKSLQVTSDASYSSELQPDSTGLCKNLFYYNSPETVLGCAVYNEQGGPTQAVILGVRPYRLDPVNLVYDIELILKAFKSDTDIFTVQGIPDPIRNAVHPTEYTLFQNYPNPFNGNTVITFHIPELSEISLSVYNLQGRLIKELVSKKTYDSGVYTVHWDGSNQLGEQVSSGIYFYRLSNGKQNVSRKMLYVK